MSSLRLAPYRVKQHKLLRLRLLTSVFSCHITDSLDGFQSSVFQTEWSKK